MQARTRGTPILKLQTFEPLRVVPHETLKMSWTQMETRLGHCGSSLSFLFSAPYPLAFGSLRHGTGGALSRPRPTRTSSSRGPTARAARSCRTTLGPSSTSATPTCRGQRRSPARRFGRPALHAAPNLAAGCRRRLPRLKQLHAGHRAHSTNPTPASEADR